MKYDIVGEYFLVDSLYYETLYETDNLSSAIRWVDGYTQWYDLGGYDRIFVHNNVTNDHEYEKTQGDEHD